ncbi:hypothetical protein MUK42_35328, partial [Musa troglodytarum]
MPRRRRPIAGRSAPLARFDAAGGLDSFGSSLVRCLYGSPADNLVLPVVNLVVCLGFLVASVLSLSLSVSGICRFYSSLIRYEDQSYVNLAKMIIVHEYPLDMVEHPAFVAFVQSLQPQFKMVDTLGYICLSGQFIDSDWKLHRSMLSFMMVSSPHSENALSEAIGISLSDWNMKSKLFTITLDNNCSSHDIYSANLRDHLSNKNMLMLKGQLFVVRCYANILNVIAEDVITSIHGIIYNICEGIKFVKASPAREEKFAEIALQLEILSTKALSLDGTTQWNTTYLMLIAALEYKRAFNFLETCDDNYNEAPSADDRMKVEVARVLSLAVVMDPRFKMKLVEFSFSKVYGADSARYVKLVDGSIHELYLEYVAQPLPLNPAYVDQGEANHINGDDSNVPTVDGLQDFDMYLFELSVNQPSKPEIDQYLEESLVPRIQDFDILNWWKLNYLKYPMLSQRWPG